MSRLFLVAVDKLMDVVDDLLVRLKKASGRAVCLSGCPLAELAGNSYLTGVEVSSSGLTRETYLRSGTQASLASAQ